MTTTNRETADRLAETNAVREELLTRLQALRPAEYGTEKHKDLIADMAHYTGRAEKLAGLLMDDAGLDWEISHFSGNCD